MIRRLFPVVVLAVLLLATSGCRDFGPGGGEAGHKQSTVVYRISGHGTADVEYAATGSSTLTRKSGVTLPWQTMVTIADHSETVYRVIARGGAGTDCSIKVNDVGAPVTRTTDDGALDCSFIK